MSFANFTFNGYLTAIKCSKDEKMKDICNKFISKVGVDINKLQFLYNGRQIQFELPFNEVINLNDKERNEINILVYEKKSTIIDENNSLIKSKNIICPKCGEICRIKINDYKITLYGCKNGHETKNILLNEFDNLQNINESLIICNKCNNCKSKTYNRKFHKCFTCKQNLCPLCVSTHNKSHKIIDYDKKDYKCNIHNYLFISYCNKCNSNLCKLCKKEHENHNLIEYKDIFYNLEEIKDNINKFKITIDKFKNNIKYIQQILNDVENNIENYYKINLNIINNFDNQETNYQILQNLNEINNNIKMSDINEIINDNNINRKFQKILNIFNKMNNKDITDYTIKDDLNNINYNNNLTNKTIINYKIDKNSNKVKIFGKIFVKNNKNNFSIIYKENIYELSEYFEIPNYNNKEDILEIKLIGINNITDLSYMFSYCNSLISLSNISDWETINIKNMSYMFDHCSSLTSLPDISNWNTINVIDMRYMFNECPSLNSFPDISKWNTINVNNISSMFSCSSISVLSIPDISKWNINKVVDMSFLFSNCYSVKTLPDISNWNTDNVKDMRSIFSYCWSLSSLPDISKWNTSNVTNISKMFYECKSLTSLPDISKWNINNVEYKESIFYGCKDSLNIPQKFK